MQTVTDLFMEIVQIDSVSGEESEMAEYLQKFFKKNCQINTIRDTHNNIFLKLPGDGEPLFFNAHIDTVEPGRGIIPVLENGRIRSKGNTILGADDKGAVAALMSAVQHITNNPGSNWRPLEILFTTSEEVGCYGAIGFDTTQLSAKTGFIFDGTGPVETIMAASPYYARFNITILGTPAHAGYPEQANPAIPTLLPLITSIESLRKEKILINIGQLTGGTARNTVIGTVHIQGEIRSYYKELFETAVNELQSLCSNTYSCELESEVVVENPGYIHTDQNLERIKLLLDELLETNSQLRWSYGVSDANIFNENPELTVFNLGDGSSGAHTTEESTTVEALEKMETLILKLAKNTVTI